MVVQVCLSSGGAVSRSRGLYMNNKQLSDLKRIIYRPSEWVSPTLALLYRSLHLKRFLLFFIAPSFLHVRYHHPRVWSSQAEAALLNENGWIGSMRVMFWSWRCWTALSYLIWTVGTSLGNVGGTAGERAIMPHVELLTVILMTTSPKRLLTHELSFDKVHAVKIGVFKFFNRCSAFWSMRVQGRERQREVDRLEGWEMRSAESQTESRHKAPGYTSVRWALLVITRTHTHTHTYVYRFLRTFIEIIHPPVQDSEHYRHVLKLNPVPDPNLNTTLTWTLVTRCSCC